MANAASPTAAPLTRVGAGRSSPAANRETGADGLMGRLGSDLPPDPLNEPAVIANRFTIDRRPAGDLPGRRTGPKGQAPGRSLMSLIP